MAASGRKRTLHTTPKFGTHHPLTHVDVRFLLLTVHSFGLAVVAAFLIVSVALLIGYAVRLSPTPLLRLASRVAVLGYSIPGAVIAVGPGKSVSYRERPLISRSLP